jgi:hypothetical protein
MTSGYLVRQSRTSGLPRPSGGHRSGDRASGVRGAQGPVGPCDRGRGGGGTPKILAAEFVNPPSQILMCNPGFWDC